MPNSLKLDFLLSCRSCVYIIGTNSLTNDIDCKCFSQLVNCLRAVVSYTFQNLVIFEDCGFVIVSILFFVISDPIVTLKRRISFSPKIINISFGMFDIELINPSENCFFLMCRVAYKN